MILILHHLLGLDIVLLCVTIITVASIEGLLTLILLNLLSSHFKHVRLPDFASNNKVFDFLLELDHFLT